MSETAGSMFAKIIIDQLEGKKVSKEREQEFVDQAAKQTGGRVSMGQVSSHKDAMEDDSSDHAFSGSIDVNDYRTHIKDINKRN